jgi:hypothetical protein
MFTDRGWSAFLDWKNGRETVRRVGRLEALFKIFYGNNPPLQQERVFAHRAG